MRFLDALELEIKKVSYRGQRMSKSQRRRAATQGFTGYSPKGGSVYMRDGRMMRSTSGGYMRHFPHKDTPETVYGIESSPAFFGSTGMRATGKNRPSSAKLRKAGVTVPFK